MEEDLTRIEVYLKKRKEEIDDLCDADSTSGFDIFRLDVEEELSRSKEHDSDLSMFIDLLISNYRFEYKGNPVDAKRVYIKAAHEALRMKERIFS